MPPAASTAPDPRTPVLVGCAQITRRSEELATARSPLELMEDAARRAAEDAGAPALLDRIDSIRIPHGVWRYGNVAWRLAGLLGREGCETGVGPISGTTVQLMLSRGAQDIQAGRRDVVLLASAEVEHWKRRATRAGLELPEWAAFGAFDPLDGSDGTPAPDQRFGGEHEQVGWWERKYRVRAIQAFSLYENEMRHQRGESLEAHRARIADLWARFAAVAADNPHAWIRDAPSAGEIAAVTPDNRMVGYPYTKRMVANMVVDQAAALLLTSLETARSLGVPEDRMVFPWASTEATKTHEISERPDLHGQPVIRLVGHRAYELADTGPEAIEHVDLYSCFPAAVQMAADELGFPLERELTVTGGLTFSGGPLNSYVMHSTAGMMDRLRARAAAGHSERGLVSSLGGYIAKHAVAIYGVEPPRTPFLHEALDAEAQKLPRRAFAEQYAGPATVETFAVMPGSDGAPDHLLLSLATPEGARAWALCRDGAVVEGVGREELCGRGVEVDPAGEARLG